MVDAGDTAPAASDWMTTRLSPQSDHQHDDKTQASAAAATSLAALHQAQVATRLVPTSAPYKSAVSVRATGTAALVGFAREGRLSAAVQNHQ